MTHIYILPSQTPYELEPKRLCGTPPHFWFSTEFCSPFSFAFGALVALEGAINHIYRFKFVKGAHDENRTTPAIMALGTLVEFVACTLRAVFAALGPMFSTTLLPFGSNYYFIETSVALGVVAVFVSTILMLRWGAFGDHHSFVNSYLPMLLSLLGVSHFVLSVVCGHLQVRPAFIPPQQRSIQIHFFACRRSWDVFSLWWFFSQCFHSLFCLPRARVSCGRGALLSSGSSSLITPLQTTSGPSTRYSSAAQAKANL